PTDKMGPRTPPYPPWPPKGFQEAPETHVSLTWQPGSFPSITMHSVCSGVSPMHGIGKMERFQPPELPPKAQRWRQGIPRGRLETFPSPQAAASVTPPWDPGRKSLGDGRRRLADDMAQIADKMQVAGA